MVVCICPLDDQLDRKGHYSSVLEPGGFVKVCMFMIFLSTAIVL